jgi:Glutathione-dependent formaldehyde-activating enzyme
MVEMSVRLGMMFLGSSPRGRERKRMVPHGPIDRKGALSQLTGTWGSALCAPYLKNAFGESLGSRRFKERIRAERMTMVQCRCGAVEVEITSELIVQFFCHCDDCQAVHGGAYAPESVYPADAVKVVRGDPLAWKLKRIPASPAASAARACLSMSKPGACEA